MQKKVYLCIIVCILIVLAGAAPVSAETASNTVNGFPIDQWQGKIFYVLPLEKYDKAGGYENFKFTTPNPQLVVGQSANIRADWLEGKKLEVLAVNPLPKGDTYGSAKDREIVFKELGSGYILTAKAYGGQVAHLVLNDDFVKAQTYFTGKTVYSKRTFISAFQAVTKSMSVKIEEPLKVVEVVPGVTASEPIWLVVKTDDSRMAYIPIHYSNTNRSTEGGKKGNPWKHVIFEQNPRTIYSWDDNTWAAINAGTVKLGMSPDQVALAWGKSQDIRYGATSDEQTWYYPDKVLKFNATGLYSINDR